MNAFLLLVTLSAVPGDTTASDGLFVKLDRNADAKVTDDELNESQRRFFQRALRVADRNEDGALSEAELLVAVADPKPFELPAIGMRGGGGMGGRPNGANLKALDRNNDGEISLDEVPPPLKQRFEDALDKAGRKSLPVADVQRYLSGDRGQKSADDSIMMESTDGKKMEPSVTPAEKTPQKKSALFGGKGKKNANRKKK